MSAGPPRVRLREVAGAAGVSISTASRVLGGKANVSPASRRAVLSASRRLNYRGDPIARALRTQRSGIVGMLVPNIGNPLFAALIQAAARTLEATDVDLMLADSHGSVEREEHWLIGLRERRVDGLLVIPVHHRDSRPALVEAAAAVPVVQIDRRVDDVAADSVAVDDTLGLSLVVDHLVGQGVERVAMISDSEATPLGRARLAAFNTAVSAHPAVQVTARMLGEFSTAFGRSAVRALASRHAVPEAIVCGSDMIALGALAELRDQGLGVPGDVLIAGFDGVIPAELTEPALTTVAQPLDAIAIEAGRLLELRIAGSHAPPQRSEIAPELLARASSRRRRPSAALP